MWTLSQHRFTSTADAHGNNKKLIQRKRKKAFHECTFFYRKYICVIFYNIFLQQKRFLYNKKALNGISCFYSVGIEVCPRACADFMENYYKKMFERDFLSLRNLVVWRGYRATEIITRFSFFFTFTCSCCDKRSGGIHSQMVSGGN